MVTARRPTITSRKDDQFRFVVKCVFEKAAPSLFTKDDLSNASMETLLEVPGYIHSNYTKKNPCPGS